MGREKKIEDRSFGHADIVLGEEEEAEIMAFAAREENQENSWSLEPNGKD